MATSDDDISVFHEPEDADLDFEAIPSLDKKSKKKGRALRKAPQAPKRFKSSYICFFTAKQSEIKAELGESANINSISKRSAELWKNLSHEERAHWNDVAAKDKQRYLEETKSYDGPWKVPWKRLKKDPSAPRRPMSAFLFYSVGKRQELREKNPDLKNTEISRILGQMWRSLTDEERRPFIDKEKNEREKYTVAIADWREKKGEEEIKRKQNAQHAIAPELLPMFADPFSGQLGVNPPFMHNGRRVPASRYPPPPGTYPFAANAKRPIILGPSGMPHWKPPVQAPKPSPPHPPQFNLAIFDDIMSPDPPF